MQIKENKDKMIIQKPKKALSTPVAAIILIVVTVAVSIAVAAWIGTLTFTWQDFVVKVDSKIYSADHNIGLLNEEGIFDIFIENKANSNSTINVIIVANEIQLFNETVIIEPMSSKNFTIPQKLIYLGTWRIELVKDKKIIYGYSFVTMLNKAEADMKITELDRMNRNEFRSSMALFVSIGSLVVSIASAIIVCYSALKKKNQKIHQKKKH